MRTYRVLVEGEDGSYTIAGIVEASGAEQAIRMVATEKGDGQYVAVPDRSWNESGAKREVRVVLTDAIADADPDDGDEADKEDAADPESLPGKTQGKISEAADGGDGAQAALLGDD